MGVSPGFSRVFKKGNLGTTAIHFDAARRMRKLGSGRHCGMQKLFSRAVHGELFIFFKIL
jgi:hypothetical protein